MKHMQEVISSNKLNVSQLAQMNGAENIQVIYLDWSNLANAIIRADTHSEMGSCVQNINKLCYNQI